MGHRGICKVTRLMEKIDSFVRQKQSEPFTIQDVCQATGASGVSIVVILSDKVHTGLLKKIARGVYQGTGQKLAIYGCPRTLVAETLWEVLRNAHTPLTLQDAVIQVERRLENQEYSAYSVVATLLSTWYYAKALDRSGARGWYEYKIKGGITDRPVSTWLSRSSA